MLRIRTYCVMRKIKNRINRLQQVEHETSKGWAAGYWEKITHAQITRIGRDENKIQK